VDTGARNFKVWSNLRFFGGLLPTAVRVGLYISIKMDLGVKPWVHSCTLNLVLIAEGSVGTGGPEIQNFVKLVVFGGFSIPHGRQHTRTLFYTDHDDICRGKAHHRLACVCQFCFSPSVWSPKKFKIWSNLQFPGPPWRHDAPITMKFSTEMHTTCSLSCAKFTPGEKWRVRSL